MDGARTAMRIKGFSHHPPSCPPSSAPVWPFLIRNEEWNIVDGQLLIDDAILQLYPHYNTRSIVQVELFMIITVDEPAFYYADYFTTHNETE